jgi:Right handed beta helix region
MWCGVILSSGTGNKACGNDIRDHNGCGVQVYGYATSAAQVLGNTIVGNRGNCIEIQAGAEGNAPAQDTLVRGNTCQGNGGDIVNHGQRSVIEANGPTAASTTTLKDDCGGTPIAQSLPAPRNLRAVTVQR